MNKPRPFFYYIRDNDGHPRVTVCLVSDGVVHARGLSFCSPRDVLSKKEGRRLALARARKAYGTKTTGEPIGRDETLTVIQKVTNSVTGRMVAENQPELYFYQNKRVFYPALIPYEAQMINKAFDRAGA